MREYELFQFIIDFCLDRSALMSTGAYLPIMSDVVVRKLLLRVFQLPWLPMYTNTGKQPVLFRIRRLQLLTSSFLRCLLPYA
eukprot:scaffold18486_cov14-Prasinocladus_malaysianus.AAC.1